MILRPSRPDDAAGALAVWRAAVDATHHFLTPEDRQAIEAEVAAFLPAAEMTLAVDAADRPIAFLIGEPGRIEALFVHPDHHGRGLGRRLVQHAAERSATLELEVNAQNPGARTFYERLGFTEIGRLPQDGQGRPYPLIRMRRAS